VENMLSIAFGLAVSVLVSVLVWTTLIAGLYQLLREQFRQASSFVQRFTQERYVQRTDAGPQVAHQQPVAGH
jgi:sensor domain CHASE-containing protein